MEFIIDTVNLEDIKEAVEYMPIVGVTSNPSIVKKTSPKDFFKSSNAPVLSPFRFLARPRSL